MTRRSRLLQLFAPGVLTASLLFLVVSDASASCLAAWLCPPQTAEDCAHGSAGERTWEQANEACTFEGRVDRASQKMERMEVKLLPVLVPFLTTPRYSVLSLPAETGHGHDPFRRAPPPPLFQLQEALLL